MSQPVDTTHDELRSAMRKAAAEFPYPVASICRRHVEAGAADPRSEWLDLVREPFHAVIHYLAHLLLAEIAACGLRPPHLFHRIVRVLGNGSEGEFVGFLREGSAFMRDHRERMLMVELLDLAGGDKGVEPDSANLLPCLHRLVELRNAIAHGDLPERVLREGVAEVRERIAELLRGVEWITRYPLRTADGMELMGTELPGRLATSEPLGLTCGDGMNLRPLLLALDGGRIGLLQRYDSDPPRLVFRGTDGLITYSRKELAGERFSGVFDEVRALLAAVRSVEASLNRYHWETFSERASLHTGRTLAEYSDEASGKYHPEQYVPRAGWEGQDGEWQRFLESPKSVLALSSEQGGGKSALAARLAGLAAEDGHAVFFIDAFQLGFVREPRLSENPLPGHWAEMMNFTQSFDPRALKSVLRGAPASKVVVFVLDSINEIDAFGSRWNRFRVMDCLLEWACAMAGPRFKLLLTFRASEFTEYGFLSDADLPPRLREVAWTREEMDDGENWIRELQPMRPEEAEQMLGRLWETRDPLAPRFSWQALEHALGGKIHEFTSNPLLFRVFLHAHAGREEIETIDREVLFERYAESLTGAAERRTAPLPLRAWYWLRDGNITRHERFLADLLTCMSRAGNSHLLSHLIDAKAKGAQRNVAREWNAPDSQILRRLGQGGMIREEAMEIRLPGGGVKQVRKLSLVADLLATAMDKLQTKIHARTQLRFNLITFFSVLILASALFMGLLRISELAMSKMEAITLQALTLDQAPAHQLEDEVFRASLQQEALLAKTENTMASGVAVLVCFGILLLLAARAPRGAGRDVGLLSRGCGVAMDAESLRKLVWTVTRIISVGLCFSLVFVVWSLLAGLQPQVAIIAPPLIAGIVLMLMMVTVGWVNMLWTVPDEKILPMHAAIKSMKEHEMAYQAGSNRKRLRDDLGLRLAPLILCSALCGASLWVVARFFHWEGHEAINTNQWLLEEVVVNARLVVEPGLLPLAVGATLAGAFLVLHAVGMLVFLRAPAFLRRRSQLLKAKLLPEYAVTGLLALGIFMVIAAVPISYHFIKRETDSGATRDVMRRLFQWSESAGTSADYDPSNDRFEILGPGVQPFSELDPIAHRLVREILIDTSVSDQVLPAPYSMPRLVSLQAPSDNLGGFRGNLLRHRSLRELIVTNAEDWLPEDGTRLPVYRLQLEGHLGAFPDIERLCPALMQFSIHETTQIQALQYFPELRSNVMIEVDSDEAPSLDWVSARMGEHPLRLLRAPDERTHLERFTKLIVPAKTDIKLLNNADGLRWLHIDQVGEIPDAGWLEVLRQVVEGHLPNLETLELSAGDAVWFDSERGSFMTSRFPGGVAYGRENILNLLQRLIEAPVRLENPQHTIQDEGDIYLLPDDD